jgi:UDP-N-acetylglucosamine diphosphorylase / glucose-1-phosphate thymidylyltransferase / UDP-N-acetylgalactosamine diphosphorylase / glucosamine-1-phosphate N-acetyltransferase / galactosamine-1-phosphate N-acetyltransferase
MGIPTVQTAVILASGKGTRFWPYSVVRQKAAFPIANVPIIRRIADSLWELGIRRLVVVTGAGERSVRAALRGAEAEVRFVRQPSPDGTADAVLYGASGFDEDFLVVAGDVATDPANIAAVVRQFTEARPLASVLVQRLEEERPQDWIVAHVDDNRLTGVEGHSRQGQHRLGGVYAFRPEALDYLRDNPGYMESVPVGGMPPLEAEIGQSLQMTLDDGQEVLAVTTAGYHVDVDKPWHILEANQQVIAGMQRTLQENMIADSARIHDGADIHGRIVAGEGCVIGNRTVIRGDLWLGDGAQVDNGAILDGPAVVGDRVTVRDYSLIGGYSSLAAQGIYGHGAEFTGVALERVHCYHYCEIWGVAGLAVDFGAATVCGNLRFDDDQTRWRIKGRVEQPGHGANAAYFGDFARTGVNAIVMPGRRIGVYSCLGAGVVAYDDVPDRELVVLRQKLDRKPWGPERYGW